MLVKKVDALTKAMEVESKKMKREAAVKEKEAAAAAAAGKLEENKNTRTLYAKRFQLKNFVSYFQFLFNFFLLHFTIHELIGSFCYNSRRLST